MTDAATLDLDDELKTFGRWDASEAEISDEGLVRYISLENILAPRSKGRHSEKQFYKADVPIAERLLNHMYVAGHRGKKHYITSGRNIGKSEKLWTIIEDAFEQIEEETGENPFQVLVDAIENSAPVEEVVTYQRGGVRARKAVLVSPQRRVDLALRLLAQGSYENRLASSEDAVETLAQEIIKAANGADDVRAVREKERREREAEGAR
ncbi:30S ribosomal protein S7 [Candidatus Nanohalovita haloferacivicina]|uniref:30S ribosomal protein S7 n=1 Tax=Candidatus Nanohalovita haloferacivicina TaxID=2978046 RepID=UPI00325FB6EB|nr:Ribosomal protein S7 [Candidatus Nanohalobia archaeon BNXNv]